MYMYHDEHIINEYTRYTFFNQMHVISFLVSFMTFKVMFEVYTYI